MSNLRLQKLIVLLGLAITIYFAILFINQNFTIHNTSYNHTLEHLKKIATSISQLQHISLFNVSAVYTGKHVLHDHILQRRDPKRLKFQLSEIQRTILNPGLTLLAAVRMKGLQQIDHQAAGWTYPRMSSMVITFTNYRKIVPCIM